MSGQVTASVTDSAVDSEEGPSIVQDSTLTAANGVAAGNSNGSDVAIVQRARIAATSRGIWCMATCLVQDSAVSMAPGSSFGVVAACSGSTSTSADLTGDNLTVVGPAGASVGATCDTNSLTAHASIDSSILRGASEALEASTSAPGAAASIDPTYDDYDRSTDGVTGTGVIHDPGVRQINADPLFVNPASGDFRIPYNSPAVDMGNPAPLGLLDSTTDLGGQPRTVNGRRDIGAFEYQRAPPSASSRGI